MHDLAASRLRLIVSLARPSSILIPALSLGHPSWCIMRHGRIATPAYNIISGALQYRRFDFVSLVNPPCSVMCLALQHHDSSLQHHRSGGPALQYHATQPCSTAIASYNITGPVTPPCSVMCPGLWNCQPRPCKVTILDCSIAGPAFQQRRARLATSCVLTCSGADHPPQCFNYIHIFSLYHSKLHFKFNKSKLYSVTA